MTSTVFLGHATEDAPIATRLAAGLQEIGISTWLASERIVAGQSITAVIGKAIQDADAVVFLISSKSSGSRWLLTEIALAVAGGKKIIPLLLDSNAKPPFLLADRFCLDLSDNSDMQFLAKKIAESMASPGNTEEELTLRQASILAQKNQLNEEQAQWRITRMAKERLMHRLLAFACIATVITLLTTGFFTEVSLDLLRAVLPLLLGLICGAAITEAMHHLADNSSFKRMGSRPR